MEPIMMLLTKANKAALPPLYSQDETPAERLIAHVKFFTPDAEWTWYACEFDPDSGQFYGLVDGLDKEFGYFALDELEHVRGPLGLPIERDRYFEPTPVSKL
jgi:hypothetical protein